VDVQVNVPRVTIINGLLPDSEIDKMHAEGDCYVSFSHSEGIGMGAVEAALHNKPVILSEYGAASEYIKSDYTIKCGMTTLPKDDFLFQKGMEWGDPDFEQLQQFMQDAYDKRLRYVDHNHTTELLSEENIKNEFRSAFL
jgi:glycosyltransferase involved in cell wall biosynthesis